MNHSPIRKTLAGGLVAEVEHCAACEIMHLHIGAFTLRLKPSALHDLRDTISRALAALPMHEGALPGQSGNRAKPADRNRH